MHIKVIDLGSPNDEKVFRAHIREYHPIEKDALYSKFAVLGHFHREQSTLYMIAKAKRITFVPASFLPLSDYRFHGRILVGDRTEQVIFNAAQMIYEEAIPKGIFDHWRSWAEEAMSLWKILELPQGTASQKYAYASSIDLDQSTDHQLYIDCKLTQAVRRGRQDIRLIVRPLALAHQFDWNVFDDVEILYIGKSTDDALKRVMNHNKWGEITTNLQDDEFAFVYFMDVQYTSAHKEVCGPLVLIYENDDANIDRDDIALITEAALIKHFFDEQKYNRQIVTQDLAKVKSVREKLVERGYTALHVELKLDGVLGRLGTRKTGFKNDHEVIYPLK